MVFAKQEHKQLLHIEISREEFCDLLNTMKVFSLEKVVV